MRKRLVWFVVLALTVLLATGGVATASQTTVTLTARLSGAQEVPAADPDGSGNKPLAAATSPDFERPSGPTKSCSSAPSAT